MPIGTRQMTDHTLEAPKGWPRPSAVDFTATINASDLADQIATAKGVVAAGSLVSLNATGEFIMGCLPTAMPMWLLQNSDDPDVSLATPVVNSVAGGWVPVAPTGRITALVAIGAYELSTTEFDQTATYAPNHLLMSADNTAANLASGKIVNGGALGNAECIVGVCSQVWTTASARNSHNQFELSFWPVYMPYQA
jgi:hypothetical protein